MSEELILEKLENLKEQYEKTDEKVEKIIVTVGLIAVQSKQIDGMQVQLRTLWMKYDDAFKPEGTISTIKQFQASCPRDDMKRSINRIWWAIGLLATLGTACLIKSFGGS